MPEEEEEAEMGLALAVLRTILQLNQADVARAAGLPASSISEYESGRTVPQARTVNRLLAGMELPPASLEAARGLVRSVRAVKGGGSSADAAAAKLGNAAAGIARSLLDLLQSSAPERPAAGGQARYDELDGAQQADPRLHAVHLWERLQPYGASERRAIVRENPEFRSRPLWELLREESEKAAARHPELSLELAELAALIAQLRVRNDLGDRTKEVPRLRFEE